jgi:hypothetical protein
MGVAALLVSAGLSLVPAGAAHARPIDDCLLEGAARYNSGTFAAGGNNYTRFDTPRLMQNNNAFRITATGTISIDFWGTDKSVNGDAELGDEHFPLPGARRYMLIARVNKGEISVPAGGPRYAAGQWFPVGFDSGCLRYHRATAITPADPSAYLTFAYNDDHIGDNGGRGNVVVRQWW